MSERTVLILYRRPRADWEIFAEVGRRLGFTKEFNFANSAAVYAEFVQLTCDRPCDYSGISHARLQQEGPIQWPCPDKNSLLKSDRSAPKRLYTDGRFHTPDERANFGAFHSRGLAEPPDKNFPFVLTTGRVYEHWHTMTRTGRIDKLIKKQPQPFLEIHPRDAKQLGIENETWIEVRSRRGMGRFLARITKAISPGTVFAPMHWGALWADNAEVNALTHPESCPISLEPELKATAVRVNTRNPVFQENRVFESEEF
jgi:ferredoxin-nitrate reductase